MEAKALLSGYNNPNGRSASVRSSHTQGLCVGVLYLLVSSEWAHFEYFELEN